VVIGRQVTAMVGVMISGQVAAEMVVGVVVGHVHKAVCL
jgi:hypothetical protein